MKTKVLIVDDNRDNLYLLKTILKGQGWDVLEALNGKAALEIAINQVPDLIVSDILMPVMDGVSLALLASRDQPALRIMLMTGYSDQRERAHGLDAIIHDILLKPFTLDELVMRVQSVLD